MPDQTHAADTPHQHGGLGKYIAVFVALCVLTAASFFTYSDMWPWRDSPGVGRTFMMAVSCTKALLVMLVFMHLFWETNWKYVLTIPAIMMSIFLLLMLVPDIGMRTRKYSAERWEHAAEVPDGEHGAEHNPSHAGGESGAEHR